VGAAVVAGLALGIAAGVGPGPLLVLVVTATLRSGVRAGLLTAAAPLATDVLVVALALTALSRVPERGLAVLGGVGAVVVVALGARTVLEARGASLAADRAAPESAWRVVRRALVVNLVSPHPWVAWIVVLGPLALTYARPEAGGTAGGITFVAAFYVGIVGAKALIAVAVGAGRERLREGGYRRALTLCGLLLVLVGGAMAVEFVPTALGAA